MLPDCRSKFLDLQLSMNYKTTVSTYERTVIAMKPYTVFFVVDVF